LQRPENYKPDLDFEPSSLYALPYFSATGTPYMDPVPKGSIIGMSLDSKREDIFKALIEGIVFEISFNLELAEKAGVKIEELRAVGGGSKSDYELQLKSSITGHPIKRMDISEAGCLATMMLAGSGIGQFTASMRQYKKYVKVKDEFYPDSRIRKDIWINSKNIKVFTK
jgi:xylulokinase